MPLPALHTNGNTNTNTWCLCQLCIQMEIQIQIPDASACSAPSSSGQGSAMRTDRLRLNLNVLVVILLMLLTIMLMLMLMLVMEMVDCGLWIAPLMRTGQVGPNLDDFKTGCLGLVFLDEDVFVNLLVTSGMISERTRRRTRLRPRALVSFIFPYIRSSVAFK